MTAPYPVIVAVIPALDEELAIFTVVERLRAAVPELDRVIVVDNGSTDATAARAEAAGATVVAEPRRGYGRACRAGLEAAGAADVILLLDGDGADDAADFGRVLAPVAGGSADLCVGTRGRARRATGAMTPQQLFGNRLASAVIRRRYGLAVTDLGPLRAIRRTALVSMEMSEMTYGWTVEMTAKTGRLGLRYVEVPVTYRARLGRSKVGGTVRGSMGAGAAILGTLWRHRNWEPAGRRVVEAGR